MNATPRKVCCKKVFNPILVSFLEDLKKLTPLFKICNPYPSGFLLKDSMKKPHTNLHQVETIIFFIYYYYIDHEGIFLGPFSCHFTPTASHSQFTFFLFCQSAVVLFVSDMNLIAAATTTPPYIYRYPTTKKRGKGAFKKSFQTLSLLRLFFPIDTLLII